jgi:hypothetical protein
VPKKIAGASISKLGTGRFTAESREDSNRNGSLKMIVKLLTVIRWFLPAGNAEIGVLNFMV